ncbi:GNAT family N-acetyltransferase [Nonomuraea glycinis]|uniref:N-acetyltransferase domain-containing protein n=1 Tax=Nonomuraea glycinis TaxID=2047744 RepID=A0A918AE63_9ACTN|nr:GNAT family N-acetyltransferase [Nonomuraea glycinis]MCA2178511.1 GNAT family N-acetyltransferase [Nonomuraea glycinis]GGP14067.1 hypothetical protein GCM10012278_68370 [Nonomuraea glycinis]
MKVLQLYLHDFSEVRELDVTPHGTFTFPYLDHYFTEEDREACFIAANGVLAGFGMTRRLKDDGSREMSEFFVLRRHRRRGVGRAAALQVLRRHPGQWRLSFNHANEAAAK